MKTTLSIILIPLWLVGWVLGFLFVPLWNGMVSGAGFMVGRETARVSRIAEEIQKERGITDDTLPPDAQEGPLPFTNSLAD